MDYQNKFTLLDGGMGTMLQQKGLQAGENPVLLNMLAPDSIMEIHKEYVDAGANIILTNTFGASAKKLEGLGFSPTEIITQAVSLAKKAADGRAKVALDIGPIGELLAPSGTLSFDDAYALFKEQVLAGVNAGADLVFIETMTDLGEVRAAILAAKEHSSLPIFTSMSFEENGRTFTGVLPESFALVATGLGVSALGLNCSMGPLEMLGIVERLAAYTHLPLIVKANAGLPHPKTGEFPMQAPEFARAVEALWEKGAIILGGCCGTTPAHIKALKETISTLSLPSVRTPQKGGILCSPTQIRHLDEALIIGERINPTGKKAFREALISGDVQFIKQEAVKQECEGAHILDVNVGVPQIDEVSMMKEAVLAVTSVSGLPLQIDSSNPKALEMGLRHYHGKALLNSVNGEQAVLDSLLPIAKKYGASILGLTLDEEGIPATAEKRLEIAKKIVKEAQKQEIEKQDVFIDCLCLTVSAEPQGANETLKALSLVKKELGLQTVLGVSNISFGLPNRGKINETFLLLALEAGLDLAIINPGDTQMMSAMAAWKLLRGKDLEARNWINHFCQKQETTAPNTQQNQDITAAIMGGLGDVSATIAKDLLNTYAPMDLVAEKLIPALDLVGEQFEKGILFLPQLLSAAQAAGCAFDVVKKALSNSGASPISKGKVLLATVKGDIHDIGKNIVAVILENYGYEVIDLGRDVAPKYILEKALQEDVSLVGLSALMTTTLPYMEETIALLAKEKPACKVMVGGAVLTADFAKEIGAHYYAKDAKEGIQIAKEVFGQ